MSAFAGHVRAAGAAPPAPGAEGALRDALRPRGPDGLAGWSDGRAVLAQARTGGVPAGHTFDEDGPLVVAGDIRLDNRADLCRAFRLRGGQRITDAALVARAYALWGTACCERLHGDFAFAVWDRRAGALFLARDRLGVRPLVYGQAPDGLRFASDPATIAEAPPRPPDEEAIAVYLAGASGAGEDTAYQGLRRLAPGHWLSWRDGSIRLGRYWALRPDEDLPDDPEEAFRARFTAAVADRLTECRRPAALLSGGLDSSAICAVGADLVPGGGPLPTYSLVYGHRPEMDESRYIDAMLAAGRFRPTKVALPGYAPLAGVEELMRLQGGPFEAPGLLKSMALYRRIAADGTDVILNGHGGDEVLWHGGGRLLELARAGRWAEALALVPTYCRLSGDDAFEVVLALAARYGPDGPVRRAARAVGRRTVGRRRRQPPPPWQRYLTRETARRADIADRLAAQSGAGTSAGAPGDGAAHLDALSSPLVPRAFELFDRATAAAGIEARYPFFDARLVTFCLGLPSSEKLRRGQTRSILRRSLRGVLPAPIAARQDKTDFLPELAGGLVTHHRDVLEAMCSDRDSALACVADLPALRSGVASLCRDPRSLPGGDVMFIWRAATMHIWLGQQSMGGDLAA